MLADTAHGLRYKRCVSNTDKLAEFTAWGQKYITGDEKGQAQIFLDRLFQAFGQSGCLDVGGTTEFRVRKSHEDGGGTAFADYVWKPIVLIEMKKRGMSEDQALEYPSKISPNVRCFVSPVLSAFRSLAKFLNRWMSSGKPDQMNRLLFADNLKWLCGTRIFPDAGIAARGRLSP